MSISADSLLQLYRQNLGEKINIDISQNYDSPTYRVSFLYQRDVNPIKLRNYRDLGEELANILDDFRKQAVRDLDSITEENRLLKEIMSRIKIQESLPEVKPELDWNAKLYLGGI